MAKKEKKILLWRILLCVLIVCNMIVVFLFSSQNGSTSAALSQKITILLVEIFSKDTDEPTPPGGVGDGIGTPSVDIDVTEPPATDSGSIGEESTPPEEITAPEETTTPEEVTTPEDPMEKLTEEQKKIVQQAHTPVRKLAHMLEFGSLGALALLLLVSWPGKLLWCYAASLGFALLYAATDELHQLFRNGRGAKLSDVAIDFAGAFIACTLLLIVVIMIRRSKRLVTTYYDLPIAPDNKPLCIGLVADLHACPHEEIVARLRAESPNIILLAGDIMEDRELCDEWSSGYAFLRSCAAIAPTYYSLGNHETVGTCRNGSLCDGEQLREIQKRIAKTGVRLLHNESVLWNGIRICGLSSGLSRKENRPNEAALSEFASAKEFRILLCHHPEYYEPYIQKTGVELTVCGHAHGGQWRIFGRGVFAPGQGILPKYTAGVIDGRLVISRGAGDHTHIPRIANPRELVIIRCRAKRETGSFL